MRLLRKFYIWLYSNIDLWLAIQKAEKAYRGEYVIGENKDKSKRYLVGRTRYYVMPDADDNLIIMNRRQMHKLRVMRVMSNEAKTRHLMKESFYYTPDGSGEGIHDTLKEYKRKKYIEYRIKTYENRKAARKQARLLRKKVRRAKRNGLQTKR